MIIDKEQWQGQEANWSHDSHTHKIECIEEVRMEYKTLNPLTVTPFFYLESTS